VLRAFGRLVVTAVLLTVSAAQSQQNGASQKTELPPCAEPQQKQFDFWVGEWELTWPDSSLSKGGHGTNSIKRTLDGCVVQESFSGGESMPLRGMSVSTFDSGAGKWKQTWVDNEGGYLDFVGEFKDGQMVLAREAQRQDGTRIQQRMVWKNMSARDLDWSWERSLDGGKTWQVVWPIHYRRKS
jgi:hypothetical protein